MEKWEKNHLSRQISKGGTGTKQSGTGVRPEKFQFLEKWKNRNFDYKIVNYG